MPNNPSPPADDDILTIPLDQVRGRLLKVMDLLKQVDALLPGLLEFSAEHRKHASRFRKGEAQALTGVLDAADANPALFQTLAGEDQGNDPKTFEVALLRDRLERAALLEPLVTEIDNLQVGINDTVLHLADLTKPVMLAAYEIVKPHAKRDLKIMALVRRTLDYFAATSLAAAETRKKNKAALAHSPPAGAAKPLPS